MKIISYEGERFIYLFTALIFAFMGIIGINNIDYVCAILLIIAVGIMDIKHMLKDALHKSQETNLEDGVREYTPLDNSAHEKSKSSPDTIHKNDGVKKQ